GQKVAEQASIVKQTVVGGPTATGATAAEQGKLATLLGKKKKKKKKQPFYEQVWFLALCLVLLVSSVTWAVWPLGEDQLMVRAEKLMASEDYADWLTARDRYLQPLVTRFPEGKNSERAREHLDMVEAEGKRRYVEANRNRDPKSEAERLY